MRVRVAQNAPHSGARVIENIQGLPQVMLSNTSLKLERRRSDDRLSVLDAEPQSDVVVGPQRALGRAHVRRDESSGLLITLESQKHEDNAFSCDQRIHVLDAVALQLSVRKSDVDAVFANIAEKAGVLDDAFTKEAFLSSLHDWESAVKPAYAEHKIALGYGVYGTPKHVIDGELVPDTESAWGAVEWAEKLKSL